MKQLVLNNGPIYRLTSYGNGFAYEIEVIDQDRALYVQGDDASALETELETIRTKFPDKTEDLCIDYLLDQCGYELKRLKALAAEDRGKVTLGDVIGAALERRG